MHVLVACIRVKTHSQFQIVSAECREGCAKPWGVVQITAGVSSKVTPFPVPQGILGEHTNIHIWSNVASITKIVVANE